MSDRLPRLLRGWPLLALVAGPAWSAPMGSRDDSRPIYDQLVQPIFDQKCVSCHGPRRQKVDLRLDSFDALMEGSEYGPVVVAGQPEASALIQVLHLPSSHERHMPPETRPQMDAGEIEALTWWVRTGARERDLLDDAVLPAEIARRLAGEGTATTEPPKATPAGGLDVASIDYTAHVEPLLTKYCVTCHGADVQKGSLRIDTLNPDMVAGPDGDAWHHLLDMIQGAAMPPRTAPQLADDERRLLVRWMRSSIEAAARARGETPRTVLRRLNKTQLTYTLQDLLGVGVDFGQVLPDDAKSKRGFSNDGAALESSTLLVEYSHEIARDAMEQAIVVGERPDPSRYRLTFGKGIGKGKVAAKTGGYQSVPLSTDDFVIEILDVHGTPKAPEDAAEQAALDDVRKRISVGLRGSSQSRFRVVDDGMILYSAVPHKEKAPTSWQGPSPNLKLEMKRCFPEKGDFVMRVMASRGFLVDSDQVLLIRLEEPVARTSIASITHPEPPPVAEETTDPVATGGDQSSDGQANADGSNAASQETSDVAAGAPPAPEPLPAEVTLTTEDGAQIFRATESDEHKNVRLDGEVLRSVDVPQASSARFHITVPKAGYYQADLVHPPAPADAMPTVRFTVRNRHLDQRLELTDEQRATERLVTPLGVAYLPAGRHPMKLGGPFFVGFSHLVMTPLAEDHPSVAPLAAKDDEMATRMAKLTPSLRAFVGTRTDDGMDYATFGKRYDVTAPLGSPQEITFHGRLENLPIPEPDTGDTEILSGFLLIGLWNDHLVYSGKEPGPPVLVESIEVEAPFYEQWPPASHTRIFVDSPLRETDLDAYTRVVLESFLPRAFRRSVDADEVDRYLGFWRAVRGDFATYEESVRETLIAVLCSPHFLYLAEPTLTEASTEQETAAIESDQDRHVRLVSLVQEDRAPLTDEALATRLSYFLWNSTPDDALLDVARERQLGEMLESEVERMLDSPRLERFVRTFAYEWLRLDRHAMMTVDANRFPAYTRFVKEDMAEETVQFLLHVLREGLPLSTLVESDFVMLTQNLAHFYGIDGVSGHAFRPVPVPVDRGRGGLLSQGAFLTGHSDGTQPHAIKRAVWVKEKILGEHPPPPPPNVPDLDPTKPGFGDMTLREQLEAHRDNPSCFDCHASIDPYGVVFERYGAVGLFEKERKGRPIETTSELPDGTEVDGVAQLKAYILGTAYEDFVSSVIDHLFTYALGRPSSFADEEGLAAIREDVRGRGESLRAVLHAIVQSDAFRGS